MSKMSDQVSFISVDMDAVEANRKNKKRLSTISLLRHSHNIMDRKSSKESVDIYGGGTASRSFTLKQSRKKFAHEHHR